MINFAVYLASLKMTFEIESKASGVKVKVTVTKYRKMVPIMHYRLMPP